MARTKKSAGILLFRLRQELPEVLLVHPGGPFWGKKDIGAWSIPKGEFTEEDPLDAAKREFMEETGMELAGEFKELSPVKLKSGKMVFCWVQEGDIDAAFVKSNMFELEWPYNSGRKQLFPEIDRAEWFFLPEAKKKINPAQADFIRQLEMIIASG